MQHKLRQHIEQVISLTDSEFAFVLSHFTLQKAKKRESLIQEGERVAYVYFVASGLLKLVYGDASGREFIVSFAMEGWWESDFYAFFTKTRATMSLQCMEDTVVYGISLENYHRLCAGLQKMEHFFLEKSNRGHIASQQRILSFLKLNAKERYERLLEQYPALLQRVPKTLIASYLGVSRETLSRIFS